MSFQRLRSGRVLAVLAIVLIASAWLEPLSALADTNLEIGGTAQIAYANGDDVRLRESPGYDGTILRMVPEGTVVDVVDGPVQDADGNSWYQVTLDEQTGYVVSDFLALTGSVSPSPDTSAPAETAPTPDPALPVFNPAGDAVGTAIIAGTNGDGVRCRTDADPAAAIIVVVPEGTLVELIGAAAGSWQPINCAGQSGYVHTDFVSYDVSGDQQAPADDASGDPAQSESSVIVGSVTVTGSGNGLRCRSGSSLDASIITVLSDGSTLDTRGDEIGGWLPVVCAGQNGYVSTAFVTADAVAAVADAPNTGSDSVTGSATVSGTGGAGVRCRASGSYDGAVLVVLSEGTAVQLRGDQQGDWQPVFCGGGSGWVFAQYLAEGSDSTSDTDAGDGAVTGSAVVTGTNGEGLRCRSGAGFNASVLMVLDEGSSLSLRGSQEGDWQPVVCGGSNGYVFADYVGTGSGNGSGDDSSTDDPGTEPSNSDIGAGQNATVTGTGGLGVRLRAGAGYGASIITVVPEGKVVSVINGSTGDWVAVSYNGTSGFIVMDYLTAGGQTGTGDTSSDGDTTSGSTDDLASGDHAVTLASLNLRYDASFTAGIAATAPEGTVVRITGPSVNGFYPIDWDGLSGYMHGDYLEWTDAGLSSRGGSGDPNNGGTTDDTDTSGGDVPATGTGQAIVNYAMQYLGYPYIWATHGPSSFDCSGFTHWVFQNVAGMEISYNNVTQYAYGYEVSRSALAPGDLVFFQNTYTWGNSHVGIYIGNGQFIHAENESTGVVISSLDSPYYGSRWYGARRLV